MFYRPRWFIVFVFFLLLVPNLAFAQNPSDGLVFWVPLQDVPDLGAVDWGLASFVKRALDEAEAAGAETVVFEIDTFGGRVDAMLFIKDAIFASPLRTVAFVNNKAWSAGVFIALACETIILTPDATMGAAEPRSGTPQEVEQPDPKTVSAIRAHIEALAEARGRDPLLFASMVDRNLQIEGLVEAGELLTLRPSEALEWGAADSVAANRQELLEQLGLTGPVKELSPSWSETLARVVTHPTISSLLIILAMGGILLELLSPGFGVPGAVGLAALFLFFGGRYLAGLAGLEPLIFFLVGMALLVLELFIPGFGVAGISGMALLIVSLYFVLRATNILFWQQALYQLLLYLALMGGVFLVILASLPQSPIWQRLGLKTEITGKAYQPEEAPTESSFDFLIGKVGVARSSLRPSGIVEVEDRRWDAITEGDFIETGTRVRVEKVRGTTLVVKPERGG